MTKGGWIGVERKMFERGYSPWDVHSDEGDW
jgi:hypothetical protein